MDLVYFDHYLNLQPNYFDTYHLYTSSFYDNVFRRCWFPCNNVESKHDDVKLNAMDMLAAMHSLGVNFDDSETVISKGWVNNRDNPRGIRTIDSPIDALLEEIISLFANKSPSYWIASHATEMNGSRRAG